MPPGRYAALLTEIGKSRPPGTVLVAGAVAGVDAYYISEIGAALQHADAVSVHPYTGAVGGPEIFLDPSAWQSGNFARLRAAVAPYGLPVLWTEFGWSTCAASAGGAPVVCAGYPGSEDSLFDQAVYLARQSLLSCLDATPAIFVYQWADGELNPSNSSDRRPEQHNTTSGSDNFGLNQALRGPAKPALLAARHLQATIGARPYIRRVVPVGDPPPPPDDALFTFVLAFGAAPAGTAGVAPAAPAPTGAAVDALAVWSLRMDGAVAERVGRGNRTQCPGWLANATAGTRAACQTACQEQPRCRSFVVDDGACALYGSRCTTPGVGGAAAAAAEAYSCRQAAPQIVSFRVDAGAGPACFGITGIDGADRGRSCADPATGVLTVEATEAPIYLVRTSG